MTERQTTPMTWVAEDLTRTEAMAKELEAYIVAGEVYRTVVIAADGNRKITMSGGDLLARLKRLHEQAGALSAEQKGRLEQVANSVQNSIYALRTRFHDLLRRELKARNDQLSWNVEIRRDRAEDKADPAEVQNRQHIAAIEAELKRPA